MKKKLYMALGLIFLTSIAANSFAASITNVSDPGGQVEIIAGVSGAQNIKFNPSTNVKMLGTTDETSFGVSAWHKQGEGKDSGQAYAMTADENKMFFMDISQGTLPTSVGTNKANLGGTWNTL